MGRLGLGLAAIGRPAYITAGRDRDLPPGRSRSALRARSHQLLDHAYAAGVRYVDVARSYGDAERFLGSWLAERAVDDVFVASKWGYTYVGDWRMDSARHEVKSHDLATFERQLAESRALLGDRLRLYQVHSVTPDSPLLADRGAAAAAGRAARRRHRGRGVHLRAAAGRGDPPAAGGDRRRRPAAVLGAGDLEPAGAVRRPRPRRGARGGPAGGGQGGGRERPAHPVRRGRSTRGWPRVAARHGVGVDAVALAAALRQPWCDVVLSGAVTEEQLDSNLAASGVTLDDGDAEALAGLAEPATAYWETRAGLPWA